MDGTHPAIMSYIYFFFIKLSTFSHLVIKLHAYIFAENLFFSRVHMQLSTILEKLKFLQKNMYEQIHAI